MPAEASRAGGARVAEGGAPRGVGQAALNLCPAAGLRLVPQPSASALRVIRSRKLGHVCHFMETEKRLAASRARGRACRPPPSLWARVGSRLPCGPGRTHSGSQAPSGAGRPPGQSGGSRGPGTTPWRCPLLPCLPVSYAGPPRTGSSEVSPARGLFVLNLAFPSLLGARHAGGQSVAMGHDLLVGWLCGPPGFPAVGPVFPLPLGESAATRNPAELPEVGSWGEGTQRPASVGSRGSCRAGTLTALPAGVSGVWGRSRANLRPLRAVALQSTCHVVGAAFGLGVSGP